LVFDDVYTVECQGLRRTKRTSYLAVTPPFDHAADWAKWRIAGTTVILGRVGMRISGHESTLVFRMLFTGRWRLGGPGIGTIGMLVVVIRWGAILHASSDTDESIHISMWCCFQLGWL